MGILIEHRENRSIAEVKIWNPSNEYNSFKNISFSVPLSILPSYILSELLESNYIHGDKVKLDDQQDILNFFHEKLHYIEAYMEYGDIEVNKIRENK